MLQNNGEGAEIIMVEIQLVKLKESDREQFILDNQEAFINLAIK